MSNVTREDGKRPLFAWALKSAIVIGALSWMASGWLSSLTRDQATMSRLASNVSKGVDDPLTTGSLAGKVAASKLDPCVVAKR